MTRREVEKAIEGISIAALRSWLKARGVTYSAGTREAMVQRLGKLIRNGKLSRDELEEGIINIEEASSKRIFLYKITSRDLKKLKDRTSFDSYLEHLSIKRSAKPIKSPILPTQPVLVYVHWTSRTIRAKWAETQTMVKTDLVNQRFKTTKTKKIVLLVVDLETGMVQLRFDKPEGLHGHLNRNGNPSEDEYFSHYLGRAEKILALKLTSMELRATLKSLLESRPRIVRLPYIDLRTGANSKVKFASKNDIRDDDDWKAMHAEGGKRQAYDGEAVYWLPSRSDGKLSREVFTVLDARAGKLRVDADCHENEIEYAISQIRSHQTKAS